MAVRIRDEEWDMAFTVGLYYPWIDIADEEWLKTAALYWEGLRTIVPASRVSPYQNTTTLALADEGILQPVRVDPEREVVRRAASQLVSLLQAGPGLDYVLNFRDYTLIHPDKLPPDLRDLISRPPHHWPLDMELQIQHEVISTGRRDYLAVDSRIGHLYMTILAIEAADSQGFALLADQSELDKVAWASRLDSGVSFQGLQEQRWDDRSERSRAYRQLREGVLSELILQGLAISEDTSVSDIIKFRRTHAPELGRFRAEVGRLAASLDGSEASDAFYQKAHDVHTNAVLPALDDLKRALTGSRIRWVTDNLLKLAFWTGGTALPASAAGLSTPLAILAGAGVSLTASLVLYRQDNEDALRTNPYSYVLAAQARFHR